jgi:hypothetical protein
MHGSIRLAAATDRWPRQARREEAAERSTTLRRAASVNACQDYGLHYGRPSGSESVEESLEAGSDRLA